MILSWVLWVALFTIGTLVLFTVAWKVQDRVLDRRAAQHREALQRAKEVEHDGRPE